MTTAMKSAVKKLLCTLGLATGLAIGTGCDEFSVGLAPYTVGFGGSGASFGGYGSYYAPTPVYAPVYTPVVTNEQYYYEETVDYGWGGWGW